LELTLFPFVVVVQAPRESAEYIFFSGYFAEQIWSFYARALGINPRTTSLGSLLHSF